MRYINFLYRGCLYLSGALLCGLCLLVIYSIAARLLGLYAGGASDIAGYLMAAATFFALAPTFRSGEHIAVSLITSRLPPQLHRQFALATHLLMLAATAYLALYLVRLVYFSYRFEERSEGADALLLWIVQLPVALGAVLFALAALHGLIETTLEYRRKKSGSDG